MPFEKLTRMSHIRASHVLKCRGGCGHGPSPQCNKRIGPNEVMKFRIWPSTKLNGQGKGNEIVVHVGAP